MFEKINIFNRLIVTWNLTKKKGGEGDRKNPRPCTAAPSPAHPPSPGLSCFYLCLVTQQICSGPRAGETSRLLTLEQNLPFGEQEVALAVRGEADGLLHNPAASCPPRPFALQG